MYEKLIKKIQRESTIFDFYQITNFGIKALNDIIRKLEYSDKIIYSNLKIAKNQILNLKPNNSLLKNSFTFIFKNVTEHNCKNYVEENIKNVKSHFISSDKIISYLGYKKIRNGSSIFTCGCSNEIISVFKKTKQNKINFEVKNSESRPYFKGRKLAIKLTDSKIPVEMYVDSGINYAISRSDVVFISAEQITPKGHILAEIGAEIIANTAKEKGVPVYVFANSWKINNNYDSKILYENHSNKTIWKERPNKIKLSRIKYDLVSQKLITGIISELGIYSPKSFLEEVKLHYPWIFSNKKKIPLLKNL